MYRPYPARAMKVVAVLFVLVGTIGASPVRAADGTTEKNEKGRKADAKVLADANRMMGRFIGNLLRISTSGRLPSIAAGSSDPALQDATGARTYATMLDQMNTIAKNLGLVPEVRAFDNTSGKGYELKYWLQTDEKTRQLQATRTICKRGDTCTMTVNFPGTSIFSAPHQPKNYLTAFANRSMIGFTTKAANATADSTILIPRKQLPIHRKSHR